jgi:hypothetical protein
MATVLKLGVKIGTVKLGMVFGSSKDCVGVCTFNAADRAHPNKMPFSGTLLVVDAASTKPPHGADGHRIYVPKAVAVKRLDTLIGMALNYSPDLDEHATRRKVGVITGAWMDGNKVKVKGFVWKKDFPEAVDALHSGNIGMSMELSDVWVKSRDADVWHLEDFYFSGATALYKRAAAYYDTSLAASARSGTGNNALSQIVLSGIRLGFRKATRG